MLGESASINDRYSLTLLSTRDIFSLSLALALPFRSYPLRFAPSHITATLLLPAWKPNISNISLLKSVATKHTDAHVALLRVRQRERRRTAARMFFVDVSFTFKRINFLAVVEYRRSAYDTHSLFIRVCVCVWWEREKNRFELKTIKSRWFKRETEFVAVAVEWIEMNVVEPWWVDYRWGDRSSSRGHHDSR